MGYTDGLGISGEGVSYAGDILPFFLFIGLAFSYFMFTFAYMNIKTD